MDMRRRNVIMGLGMAGVMVAFQGGRPAYATPAYIEGDRLYAIMRLKKRYGEKWERYFDQESMIECEIKRIKAKNKNLGCGGKGSVGGTRD